jgi:hypothetical protein
MNKDQKNYQNDILKILKAMESSNDPNLKSRLAQYLNISRPYYTPAFCQQDLIKKNSRFCNLLGGFPFTSIEFPWPCDSNTNEYLQPLIQLDLSIVSRLLGRNLEKGLVQVWGYSEEKYDQFKYEIRTILGTPNRKSLSEFFPSTIARSLDFGEFKMNNPKLKWRAAGGMFLRNFEHVSKVDEITMLELDPINMLSDEPCDHLSIQIYEDFEILDHLRNLPYYGTYLGGHGGSYRSLGINPIDGFLVCRISHQGDSIIDLFAKYKSDGSIGFEIEESYLG